MRRGLWMCDFEGQKHSIADPQVVEVAHRLNVVRFESNAFCGLIDCLVLLVDDSPTDE